MTKRIAVLDACVLAPIRLASTLLWLAEDYLFQPLWSGRILAEVERTLLKLGVPADKAHRRVGAMRRAFGDDAMVQRFEHREPGLRCDPKDRHVLAAAIHAQADTLVTFNLKDFPAESASPHGIRIVDPDTFLTELLEAEPDQTVDVLDRAIATLNTPEMSPSEFFGSLSSTAPHFARKAANLFPPEN